MALSKKESSIKSKVPDTLDRIDILIERLNDTLAQIKKMLGVEDIS